MVEFDDTRAAAEKIALMGEAVVKWQRKGERYWPGPPDPERQCNHAWFMAFAPAHKPEVSVSVLIEYGMEGGRKAGPVARSILEHIFGVETSHKEVLPADMGPTD
jgi:hypothetical protein